MVTRRARSPTRRQPGRPEHATALTASQHGRLKRLRSISPVRKMLARRFPKTLHLKGSMLDPEKDAELIDSDVLALQDILTSDVSEASEKENALQQLEVMGDADSRRISSGVVWFFVIVVIALLMLIVIGLYVGAALRSLGRVLIFIGERIARVGKMLLWMGGGGGR